MSRPHVDPAVLRALRERAFRRALFLAVLLRLFGLLLGAGGVLLIVLGALHVGG